MVADDGELYISSFDDRSVLHGDAVYYIHGNTVTQGQWGN